MIASAARFTAPVPYPDYVDFDAFTSASEAGAPGP
jgi:hypothetical protein